MTQTENVIEIRNLTKDFGGNRGIFDLTFSVRRGEVFGFLGPNGAGKTTTIRNLLGFIRPQKGNATINGLDCWRDACEIQRNLGYLAGEIAVPDGTSGWMFLKQLARVRHVDLARVEELCKYFQLDPHGDMKRMSKGMKQKIGLVVAFMHDPEIIILDEPTSGLDPLMQAQFCEFIKAEKQKGKTILMSSHIFEEIEKTCDRVAVIKQGRIVTEAVVKDIENRREKEMEIRFKTRAEAESFAKLGYKLTEQKFEKNRVTVYVKNEEFDKLIADLHKRHVEYISEIKFNLEKFFMAYYKDDSQRSEVKS